MSTLVITVSGKSSDSDLMMAKAVEIAGEDAFLIDAKGLYQGHALPPESSKNWIVQGDRKYPCFQRLLSMAYQGQYIHDIPRQDAAVAKAPALIVIVEFREPSTSPRGHNNQQP
jgi:hypothetical protein